MAKKRAKRAAVEAEIVADKTKATAAEKSAPPASFWRAQFWPAVGWVVWLAVAFFAAQIIAAILLLPLQEVGVIDIKQLSTLASALIEASLYALILLIAVGIPLRRARQTDAKSGEKIWSWRSARQAVGLNRQPRWSDLGMTLSNAPMFYILVMLVSFAAQFLLGGGVMSQEQTLSFATTGNVWWQLIIIFAALVVVAPLAEEMLMRGFLFAKLRAKLPFWPVAVIVSLLFAVAHWQLNVGIMTFILSMFTCRMREKTGAIWAGVGLHMVVNLVAFSLRFIFNIG